MNITNLAHASYRVSDREKALHFYRDILGLKIIFTIQYDEQVEFQDSLSDGDPAMRAFTDSMRRFGDKIWITYLEAAPHQYIELFSAEGGEKTITFDTGQFDHIGYLHLALEVDDIMAAFQEMQEKEVTILNRPTLGVENTWQFWILDPDGNAIELMEYTKDSWQLTGKKTG